MPKKKRVLTIRETDVGEVVVYSPKTGKGSRRRRVQVFYKPPRWVRSGVYAHRRDGKDTLGFGCQVHSLTDWRKADVVEDILRRYYPEYSLDDTEIEAIVSPWTYNDEQKLEAMGVERLRRIRFNRRNKRHRERILTLLPQVLVEVERDLNRLDQRKKNAA